MLRYASRSTGPATDAWALLARPARWHEWSPHVRGAWGLGGADGVVRPGARGAARLLGVVPVPATVTRVDAPRAWTWRVGPVELDHAVRPLRGGGCEVATTLRAPRVLEPVLAVGYGPVVALLMRRLARVAARP
jgi:hypothetical protein